MAQEKRSLIPDGESPRDLARLARNGGGLASAAAEERQIARQLATAMDRAMEDSRFEQADRIALSAARLARRHPALSERLARLRLAQGDADTALAIIDGCALRPASLRLLRAACLILRGRRAEAHLDLHGWSRLSTAPLNARVMLAILELDDRQPEAALAALHRNLRCLEDPRTLAVQALACLEAGSESAARETARRLWAAAPADESTRPFRLMIHSLGIGAHRRESAPSPARIERLAIELVTNEPVISALVEAQLRRPRTEIEPLLSAAIEAALPQLADRAGAMESLALLARSRGELAISRQWVSRGLALRPMSASMARLQRELDEPRASVTSEIVGRVGGVDTQEKAA